MRVRHTQALGAAGRSHRAGPCRVHRFCAQRRTSGYLTQPCNRSHLCTFGAMLLPLHTICEEMPCHARDGQQGVVHPRLLRPRTGPENCPENWVARELGFHGVSDLAMVGTAQCQIPLPPFTFRQPRQTYDWLSTDPSTPRPPGPVLCGPECGRGLFQSCSLEHASPHARLTRPGARPGARP